MNITNDYMKVSELAKEKKLTQRSIRNRIEKLIGTIGDNKIIRGNNDEWRIHKSIKNLFDPIRIHVKKYTAITIDPVNIYNSQDLKKIMVWIKEGLKDADVEINYTIEQKKFGDRNHLHLYIPKQSSNKFLKGAKIAFPFMSYHLAEIYDLTGWKNYIKKENDIITI